MSEAWDRTHRRYALTQAVLGDIAGTGTAAITPHRQAQLEAEYGELAGFLQELQARWYRIFDARLDMVLETTTAGHDPGRAVRALWQQLAAEHPAMWQLLQAHRTDPALAAGQAVHRARLQTAGLAGAPDEPEPEPAPTRAQHPGTAAGIDRCPIRHAWRLLQSAKGRPRNAAASYTQ